MRTSFLGLGLAMSLSLAAHTSAEEAAPAAEIPSGSATPAGAEAASPAPAPAAAPAAPAPRAETTAASGIVLGPIATDAEGKKGRIHEVKSGDTLWEISDAYLGTPWVWPSVWKDNGEIEDPHRIFPGDKLFVSATEMRRLSPEEAAGMLAGAAAEQAPAALADGMDAGPRSFRYAQIDTVGFVSTEELEGAASIVDSTVDRVWLGDHDTVIVGLGEGETEVGAQYEIFHTVGTVEDPETELPAGYATLDLGWLEVVEVHPETSVAMIRLSRDEVRRGDRLLPRVLPSSEIRVEPKPEVEGRVIHTVNERVDVGGNDVVYLNRGTDDGLQVGSPLEVYRPIGSGVDAAQRRERKLPDHVIAKLLVVRATPKTASALVTHASTEIRRGDWVRGADSIAR
jgi:hypothetical protein